MNIEIKENLKNTKGITLIALVITIVVLLILAGVSINAIFSENGIINRAKEAQNKMDQAVENDQKEMNELSNWLENQMNGNDGENTPPTPAVEWTQNKTLVTNGTTTYEVGDNYTYDCGVEGYTGGWKVLGVEDGKLLIMSTVDIGTLGLKGISGDETITYPAGYINGVDKLNEMCAQYGKNARSITVEDINRVTGYIPVHKTVSITSENKYYFDNDQKNQSPTATGTNAAYAGIYGLATALGITDNSPVTGNAWYYYYPNTLTTSSDGTTVGIETTSKAYKLLFRNAEDTENCQYWLASSYAIADVNFGDLGIRFVNSIGYVDDYLLWRSDYGSRNAIIGVRAVVKV